MLHVSVKITIMEAKHNTHMYPYLFLVMNSN